MRAVAEYVMRGRTQALWVAVVTAAVPMLFWLGAAVLALVTLRRGPAEGAWILAWSALPAGVLLVLVGDVLPLFVLVGAALLAALLRWTASWPVTLVGAISLGAALGLGLLFLGTSYLDRMTEMLAQWFAGMERELAAGGQAVRWEAPDAGALAGMLAMVNTVVCVGSLLLARWWQAALYNPGGFRREFHGLRYPPLVAAALLSPLFVFSAAGLNHPLWAMLFAMPLALAGLGLIHAYAARFRLTGLYLAVFYLLWVLLDPVKWLVVGLALVDSVRDFRGRWLPTAPRDISGDN